MKEYLEILHDAAHESETAVDEALRSLQANEQPVTAEAVRQFDRKETLVTPVTDVQVCQTDLTSFDKLFSDVSVFLNKEVFHECHGCEPDTSESPWSCERVPFNHPNSESILWTDRYDASYPKAMQACKTAKTNLGELCQER